MAKSKHARSVITWLEKYLRYVNYIGAAQLYLKDNFLLRHPLLPEHVKERILGHWGTVPGINFIYAHLNYLISQTQAEIMFMAGSGHGAPGVLANVFAEGTLGEYYEPCSRDAKGMGYLLKQFSWPNGFPSHTTPMVPGTILEGGELGYSLATAYGAILDNPNLIVCCLIGDGEAESGPLAAAWHSNKFVNPAESGAVLPIVHLNGYKISGPTVMSTMSDQELKKLFEGYGYGVRFVEGNLAHKAMIRTLKWAHGEITAIWHEARSKKSPLLCPRWPLIIFRNLKGYSGLKNLSGKKVEGNFRSHGIPLDPKGDPKSVGLLEEWLRSYKINELIDFKGRPLPGVLEYVPQGALRMGKNRHAYAGDLRRNLVLPKAADYEVAVGKRGETHTSNTATAAAFIRDIFMANEETKNFRFMCPDETDSNKMGALFEATGRAYMWPLQKYDEWMSPTGRVMEILSEHTLQGWLQGYLLTGRHGMFATYEAFAMIVASMVDQYAKFIKQSRKVPWRRPLASLNYLLTSLGWRQEHNGFSHQNPGFVGTVLQKHGEFCSAYFPPDANSLLVTVENCLKRKDAINIIVAGKQNMPQWLTLNEARAQLRKGIGVWEWAHEGTKNPDVVFAPIGDHMVIEVMAAVSILKAEVPEMNVRVVNVSELTALGFGDEHSPLKQKSFDRYFTPDKPIIFVFHGYPDVIKQLLWAMCEPSRAAIRGYCEEGTTTTPFDMHVRNGTSRFHLVMDAIVRAAGVNESVAKKADKLIKKFEHKLTAHQKFIVKHGKDMPEIEEWRWQKVTTG